MSYIHSDGNLIEQDFNENSYINRHYSEKENFKLPPAEIIRSSKVMSESKLTNEQNSNLILPIIQTKNCDPMKKMILTNKPFPLLNLLSNKDFIHLPSESYLNNFMINHLMKRKIFEFQYKDKNSLKNKNPKNFDKKISSLSKLHNSKPSVSSLKFSTKSEDKIKDIATPLFPNFLSPNVVKNKSNNEKILYSRLHSEANIKTDEIYMIKKSDDILIKKAKIQLFKIKKKDYLKSKNNS